MERTLPTYEIEGTTFIVDINAGEFIEQKNTTNRIPLEAMKYKGNHYDLSYDKVNKNVATGENNNDLVHVKVPLLKDLDFLGMEQKYGFRPLAENDYDYIYGFLTAGFALEDGECIIRLNGEHYTVNKLEEKLISINRELENINIDDFIARYIFDEDVLFFDLVGNVPYEIKYELADPFPSYIAKLEIPEDIKDKSIQEVWDLFIDRQCPDNPVVSDIKELNAKISNSLILSEVYRQEHIKAANRHGQGLEPTYKIHDTAFYVDVIKNELRQVTNPENSISFRDMVYKDDHYLLDYDKVFKNVRQGFDSDWNNILKIKVPHLTKLNPEGMALKYNVPLEKVKQMEDFDLIVDKKLFDLRMAGRQPVMNIGKESYYVHLFGRQLSHTEDFCINLRLDEFTKLKHDGIYHGLYDTKRHRVIRIDRDKITSLPKDVICIEFPIDRFIDPVGYAKLRDHDIKNFVRLYPIKPDLQATVIPWEKTIYPELIEHNKSKLKIREMQQQAAKKTRRRKGKGI
ncbi:hypothetical protein [Taibaiella chishuiensis]|uniref:Uncharacterized protein n=1 Tax=Taibaiella chishuiensis TaxID=1434707 RepID=A0A2P8D0P7_9BACT|nr:hypothetical protein [Taibaiella chishuiensis]PSK90785.1 hypothetical protein B0I18_107197 [Taibaiella chishuiensis]